MTAPVSPSADAVARVPVHSESSEACLIGSILWDPKAFDLANDVVRPEDFYARVHREIFVAMRSLAERGDLPDVALVVAELDARGVAKDVCGREALTACFESVESGANVMTWARKVRDLAHRRAVAIDLEEGLRLVRDGACLGAEVVERVRCAFDGHETVSEGKAQGIAELIELALRDAETPILDSTVFPTGLIDLDAKVTIRPGNLVIVAGRPSMGKSSALEGFALYASVIERIPVAYFSLEMLGSEVATKLVAKRSGLCLDAFRPGNLGLRSNPRLVEAVEELKDAPIFVDEAAGLTPADIRARARGLIRKHGVKGVFVDHLGKLRGPAHASRWSVTETTGAIVSELKNVAKTLGVPMFVACQLNRDVDRREGNRPVLSDLRQSGEIEQEADIVFLLYRKHYYSKAESDRGLAEIIVGKQRMGWTGTINVAWAEHCCRFDSLSRSVKS